MNIDFKQLGASLNGQFQDLSGRPPGQWPIVPRLLCGLGVVAAVLTAGYFFYWSDQLAEQERLAATELKLKDDYRAKISQAINLPALEEQRAQVTTYVARLQKQLPSKAEMAALLSDINQAGVGRGLTFELFKPGSVLVKDYYAELPIQIQVVGRYHDVGAFASDMANLPRIVTLNNMALSTNKDGMLTLDAVAKTFRYLEDEEVQAQRKLADDAKKKAKKSK